MMNGFIHRAHLGAVRCSSRASRNAFGYWLMFSPVKVETEVNWP